MKQKVKDLINKILNAVRENKEFWIGILSIAVFLSAMVLVVNGLKTPKKNDDFAPGSSMIEKGKEPENDQPGKQQPSGETAATDTPAPKSPTPTGKPSLTPTNTVTPSPTNTPTPLPAPTVTETPAPTPTMTPLEAEEARLYEQYEEKKKTYNYVRMKDVIRINEYTFPVISITTLDSLPVWSREETVTCIVDVINCDEKYALTEFAQIRVRGNSSAAPAEGAASDKGRAEAKDEAYPYKLKFDSKQSMLGLNDGNRFKDWVLLEGTWHAVDHMTGYRLFETLSGGKYYSSDSCFVHVYLNGKSMGLYTLCEQNEVKKNRVNLSEPDEGYTGTDIGYFLEIDNYAKASENPFISVSHEGAKVTDVQGLTKKFRSRNYTIHSDITSDKQKTFISNYINNVFKIVFEAVEHDNYLMFDKDYNLVSATGTYDNAKDAIGAVLDLDSVVCSYLVQEITTNYDRGEGSFFMAVDFAPNGVYRKLTFLAPWDFEWGYFGSDSFPNEKYSLLAGAFDSISWSSWAGDRANYWFVLLMKEDWFRDMVSEKWAAAYSSGELMETLDSIVEYMNGGKNDMDAYVAYGNSVKYVINRAKERMEWLDKNWFGKK